MEEEKKERDPGGENLSSLHLGDIIYGTIFQPAATLSNIADRKPVGLVFLLVLAFSLLSGVVGYIVGRTELQPHLPGAIPQLSANLLWLACFGGILFNLVQWVLAAGFWNLLAVFFGGRENSKGLFAALGLLAIPATVFLPVQVLNRSNLLPGALFSILSLGLLVWLCVLAVLAIKEANGLTAGRAAAVFFLPLILGLVIIVILAVALVSVFAPLFELFGSGAMPPF